MDVNQLCCLVSVGCVPSSGLGLFSFLVGTSVQCVRTSDRFGSDGRALGIGVADVRCFRIGSRMVSYPPSGAHFLSLLYPHTVPAQPGLVRATLSPGVSRPLSPPH